MLKVFHIVLFLNLALLASIFTSTLIFSFHTKVFILTFSIRTYFHLSAAATPDTWISVLEINKGFSYLVVHLFIFLQYMPSLNCITIKNSYICCGCSAADQSNQLIISCGLYWLRIWPKHSWHSAFFPLNITFAKWLTQHGGTCVLDGQTVSVSSGYTVCKETAAKRKVTVCL